MVDRLRSAADNAHNRLWIASPYVGGWKAGVRRILGTQWQGRVKDVRLLTDIEGGNYKRDTMVHFLRRGSVRTLLGLHAKLYIADDFILLASANLTRTAFSMRYELGVILNGAAFQEAIQLFEKWWRKARQVREDGLPNQQPGSAEPGETSGVKLRLLNALPPDAKDKPSPPKAAGDYHQFLEAYRELAGIYESIQRIWKKQILYFEVDAFLNFLYHAGNRPSKKYGVAPRRRLTVQERLSEIKRHAAKFAKDASGDNRGDSEVDRAKRSLIVRNMLKSGHLPTLTKSEIETLLGQLNAIRSYPINQARILNSNTLSRLRGMLKIVADTQIPVQQRIADATSIAEFVGPSIVQELIGFYEPDRYPLRNKNTNCGLRFFGYDVRV